MYLKVRWNFIHFFISQFSCIFACTYTLSFAFNPPPVSIRFFCLWAFTLYYFVCYWSTPFSILISIGSGQWWICSFLFTWSYFYFTLIFESEFYWIWCSGWAGISAHWGEPFCLDAVGLGLEGRVGFAWFWPSLPVGDPSSGLDLWLSFMLWNQIQLR